MARHVAVFCGSHDGADPAFAVAATALGTALATHGHTLVYGGAHLGLMGRLADAALAAGGQVIGVMPRAMIVRERAHRGLTALHEVDSMHERKARMAELADGFVALPGGIGTFDELFEIWTWRHLGLHDKPIALFDVNNYFAPLIDFLDRSVAAGFVGPTARALVTRATTANDVIAQVT